MAEEDVVQVLRQRAALGSPTFVVEYDGKLYATVAVLEYDPKARSLTPEQKRGVKQMRDLFDASQKEGSLRAGRLEADWMLFGPMNSGPRPPVPGGG